MILIIYDCGKYISIPGFKQYRTPLKIEVGDSNIDLIKSYLKSNGIQKFEFLQSGVVSKSNNRTNFIKNNIEETRTEDVNLPNKLDRIEELLLKLLEKDTSNYHSYIQPTKNTNNFSVPDSDDEKFIPDISLDGMEQKNNLTNGTKLSKDVNIEELADLLKGL